MNGNNNEATLNKYARDFSKIYELMKKTLDRYSVEFLEAKGISNPLSEENKNKIFQQLNTCTNDEQYIKIVDSYLQSFHQGHLFLNQKKPKPSDVFPLIVRYVDGKYVVGVSNNDILEGKEISAINGIPITEYVLNHTFENGDRAFAFDKDGKLYSPEFQLNDGVCNLTMIDGTEQPIEKISREDAIKIMSQKTDINKENVLCGYLEGSGIPYISIQSFSRDKDGKQQDKKIIEEFAKKLNQDGQTDIVIDIRGNGGGSDEYFDYLGAFADKEYSQEHEYEQLVGLKNNELNEIHGKSEDIDVVLQRLENNPNREVDSHISVIPNGNSTITNRVLLVDGEVFSSADKFAKTAQGSGFATIASSQPTAGDGKGITTYSVDTSILREQGISITMPSSMGLNFNEFQTDPDIFVNDNDLNNNLSQIMEEVKKQNNAELDIEKQNEFETEMNQDDTIVEWNEIGKEPERIQEQDHDTVIEHIEVAPQINQNQALGQNNASQVQNHSNMNNSVNVVSEGRTR